MHSSPTPDSDPEPEPLPPLLAPHPDPRVHDLGPLVEAPHICADPPDTCFCISWVYLQEWNCGITWYHSVVLTCIFLTADDTEHLFICLLAICIYSLEKCPLPFKIIGLFLFLLLLGSKSYLYILDTSPLSDI